MNDGAVTAFLPNFVAFCKRPEVLEEAVRRLKTLAG
ncbi:hypothetical protein STENM223S_11920 [Streptomyces tendae]